MVCERACLKCSEVRVLSPTVATTVGAKVAGRMRTALSLGTMTYSSEIPRRSPRTPDDLSAHEFLSPSDSHCLPSSCIVNSDIDQDLSATIRLVAQLEGLYTCVAQRNKVSKFYK